MAKQGNKGEPVLFRVDRAGDFKGTVTAVFPCMEGSPGLMTCYAHVGQHSSCSLGWMLQKTRPARPEEYGALATELRSLGYKLDIRKRSPSCRRRLG